MGEYTIDSIDDSRIIYFIATVSYTRACGATHEWNDFLFAVGGRQIAQLVEVQSRRMDALNVAQGVLCSIAPVCLGRWLNPLMNESR
jgi:hypothetical protein